MRRVIVPLVVSALAMALTGCSEPNPYPRVDYPSNAGNFIQFYLDGVTPFVELAKVDASGTAVTLKSSAWHGRVRVENGLHNQTAAFPECGVTLSFRDLGDGRVNTSAAVASEVAKKSCPLGPLPAQWQLVSPPAGGRND
ncbi:hypothetical protein [Pseudomonas aeruginosa]|jgi:hypothetical protein|uniref:hypothetical protein n=1 Tax=Pseudomonas aeruginosa TaxID=287 RepID=UPI000B148D06|nr:hypothetical protein [Pseudomonas aeruginosa]